MNIIIFAIIVVTILFFYKRYFPIWYVPSVENTNKKYGGNVILVDVRDYYDARHKPVQGAFHLPYAYLKRHHPQITKGEVVVVASDPVLKNLSIRFLKGHGFNVVGYQLIK